MGSLREEKLSNQERLSYRAIVRGIGESLLPRKLVKDENLTALANLIAKETKEKVKSEYSGLKPIIGEEES